MYVLSGHKIIIASVFGMALLLVSHEAPVFAQEGNNIEGAIWEFELVKKGQSPSTVNGQFRVFEHAVYQKEMRNSPGFDKKVGTNKPNGKLTRTEFEGLRVFDAKRSPSSLSGVATLKMDNLGEWSGNFTDGDGANWGMKLSRVKE